MSIVLKLQKKCLDSNQDLQSLLRESLLISSKLNLVEFNAWIKYELFGYPNQEITPDYRKVSTTLSFLIHIEDGYLLMSLLNLKMVWDIQKIHKLLGNLST